MIKTTAQRLAAASRKLPAYTSPLTARIRPSFSALVLGNLDQLRAESTFTAEWSRVEETSTLLPNQFPKHFPPAAESTPRQSDVNIQDAKRKDKMPIAADTETKAVSTHSAVATAEPSSTEQEQYWTKIPRWKDTPSEVFNTYAWQKKESINTKEQLAAFLEEIYKDTQFAMSSNPRFQHIRTGAQFIEEAMKGIQKATMAVCMTPHVLSVVDWEHALDDPIRTQFIPVHAGFIGDHPKLSLDSLHESADSPVDGLVHRYPDKVLFLANAICPVYCRFCTRSYAVGKSTETVTKKRIAPSRKRWNAMYDYIEKTPEVQDVVVSGGDTYMLEPEHLLEIGMRLLEIDNVRRIRFATRGLAVFPARTIDPNDMWTKNLIQLSEEGRKRGKQVCLHTHFEHPNEITWVTKAAAHHLFKNSVIVRNQSVLLKGINDSVETMGQLIRELGDMNITPYYVYQCDLVRGIEDLRTPLSTILDIEEQLRGTIAGFMMPSFVVDLPGGGGKRLAASGVYDRTTGISTFKAPGLKGEKAERIYEYFDPRPEPETKSLAFVSTESDSLSSDSSPEEPDSIHTPVAAASA